MTGPPTTPVEPGVASTGALLRSAPSGIEILYLQRNPALRFQGGYWVFPGGRIDPSDAHGSETLDAAPAAKRAAVREASEEAGLDVSESSLVFAVHWTTPTPSPIRFATWFFMAQAPDAAVTIDRGEIIDHRWLSPRDALDAQREGRMPLAAPTFALTTRLLEQRDVNSALAAVSAWPDERLLGRLHNVDGGQVALYAQDAAYETGRVHQQGPRHRLWMVDTGWRYERSF